MTFLPKDFAIPVPEETRIFRIRPLTIHDVVKDYEAVMSSREHLWAMFGDCWGWPPEDLSFEQDFIDLGWHQKEGQLRSSFAFAVVSPDEKRMLGCVYLDPTKKSGFDAEVCLWVRQSELENGLDEELFEVVKNWVQLDWPFKKVIYPGRDISWEDYRKME